MTLMLGGGFLDWDLGDNTLLKLTTESYEGDDNRTNIGTVTVILILYTVVIL